MPSLGRRAAWVLAASLLLALTAFARPAHAAVPGDGRVWELATPTATNGDRLMGAQAWTDDGDRVALVSVGPLPGSTSGDIIARSTATRTPSGWVLQPLGVPFTAGELILEVTKPLATDAGLSTWLFSSDRALLPGAAPSPDFSVYRRAPDGTLTYLADAGDDSLWSFVGTSADLGHAVFDTTAHLLPGDAGRIAGGDAYELVGSQVRMVGLDDGGAPVSACGSHVGDGTPQVRELGPISSDGSRVFFTAPDSAACSEPQRVYLRENGTATTEISASQCTRADCDAPQDVTFAGATADGAHAFLVTSQQLTDDDVDAGQDLYRYDVGSRQLTRLSAGAPGTTADVSGTIVRASADGTRAYFVATGQLLPGEGVQGSPNLYLSDHGTLRFVATVPGIDLAAAQISADGHVLAFSTTAQLLPGDTDTAADVYRYDADADALTQVSAGAGGSGDGPFDALLEGAQGETLAQQPTLSMSADGAHVVFHTSESLLPADRNATDDIYEWADGQLGLISSGAADAAPPIYGGISADGRSVFFVTSDSLLPADDDNGDDDLYDARLGGGFPPAPPAPSCEGDACQGPLAGRVALPHPATLDYAEPPDAPALTVHALGAAARRQLAATGRATLVADAPLAGRVTLVARARIHRRLVVVAHDAVRAARAGRVRLTLRLSPAARRVLRGGGRLHVTVVVRQTGVHAARTLALELRRAR